MIKEKLMKALKTAAADYNGGMSANAAVACAAEAWDFNEKQAERLTEMFNTLATLNKEKDASDPAGSCELASKDDVIKILLGNCGEKKEASVSAPDYSFYSSIPEKTNLTIEARKTGIEGMAKAASASEEPIPAELNVSQRSLYKIIEGQIDMLKSASAAADDVVRNLRLEIERDSVKIAKAIESPFADNDMADMFKAACQSANAVRSVSEYSSKVADSDGGRFAKMNVFDASPVEDLLKVAETIESNMAEVSEYEHKRDFYMAKAAAAQAEMNDAVGLIPRKEEHVGHLADMFHGVPKTAGAEENAIDDAIKARADSMSKMAELIEKHDITSDDVKELIDYLEKDAAPGLLLPVSVPSVDEAHSAISKLPGIDNERKRIMNVRRSIILADLMANDPIIRDADPNVVAEAYKTMIMASPRVSLDKAQARAFLRSSVNSVAISPADAKVITDVDWGMSRSNIDAISRLTAADSSIKDSNKK